MLPENLERWETAVAASLVIAISVVVITLVLNLGWGLGCKRSVCVAAALYRLKYRAAFSEAFGVGVTTCLPDPATPAPWHLATGLGVCASCLSCLLVLISPFYEHRPYRTATAETRVLEDKTLIGAMVEIDANVEAFHVIDELGWDCRAAEVAKVGCDFHG